MGSSGNKKARGERELGGGNTLSDLPVFTPRGTYLCLESLQPSAAKSCVKSVSSLCARRRASMAVWVVSGHRGPKVLRRLDLQVRKSIEVPRPGANDYHVPAGPGCPQVTPACWSPKSSGILFAVISLYLQSFGEVMDLEHCERPVYRGSSLQLARHQEWRRPGMSQRGHPK